MPRSRFRPRWRTLGQLARSALTAAALPVMSSQVLASSCADMQTYLRERKSLVSNIQAMTEGGRKIDAACPAFRKLVANGTAALKWAETNKNGCQISDAWVENLKSDHGRIVAMRHRACARWRQDPPGGPANPALSADITAWMPRWLLRPRPPEIILWAE